MRDVAVTGVQTCALPIFLRMLHELAGPAVGDVRALVATIRAEAEGLAGTSRELRQRIVSAADAAEARLAELDAVFEVRSEEHTSELQSRLHLVCRLLLEKKKKEKTQVT